MAVCAIPCFALPPWLLIPGVDLYSGITGRPIQRPFSTSHLRTSLHSTQWSTHPASSRRATPTASAKHTRAQSTSPSTTPAPGAS